jgi:hypothetical protein
MASSIKSIDYFNELSSGKKCNDSGCDTWIKFIWIFFIGDYGCY